MKRKYGMAAGIVVFMLAAATGCGSGQETERADTVLTSENRADGDTGQQGMGEEGERDALKNDVPEDSAPENGAPENSSSEITVADSDGMIIGGKVRSIAQDSFVISRVLMEEDSSVVVIPEEGSPEEELVTVRCTDLTTFEHWTIQGGGAGIVKEEASFSDIQENGGLEAEGYFDGDEFVAEKVIIEVYE